VCSSDLDNNLGADRGTCTEVVIADW